jgi:16S rRNA pseudouridine516 synthase
MRRLDQYLANLGYCSRREARGWIDAGRVRVSGVPASDPGQKSAAAAVTVDGEPLDHPEGLLLALHKPLGSVCSHDAREGPRVYDLLPSRWQRRNPQVTSVGRLDQDTTGLLLLTDQTGLVHRLTAPKHKIPKVYRAGFGREVPESARRDLVALFAAGTLVLPGETDPCRPAPVAWPAPREAQITLIEGRHHQVRRMFASQGMIVKTLHRIRLGNLDLGDIAPGTWRELPLDYDFLARADQPPGD